MFLKIFNEYLCATTDIITHWLRFCTTNNNLRCLSIGEYTDAIGKQNYLDSMFSDPRKGGESLLDQALKTRYDRLENFQPAKTLCNTRAAPHK